MARYAGWSRGAGDGDAIGGEPYNHTGYNRWVDTNGYPAVTYVDENYIGYVFTSERMSQQELLAIVGMSDLITRASQLL